MSTNLGISDSTLKTWLRAAREHEGSVPTQKSGNYSSDEAKEIARLQCELRAIKDPPEILKSISWGKDRGCQFVSDEFRKEKKYIHG